MVRLDDHLLELQKAGEITKETMYEYAMNPSELAMKLGESSPQAPATEGG
jgi:hypothetical protein